MTTYTDFIASRRPVALRDGMEPPIDINPALFSHQRHCLEFALRTGRSAMFLDCVAGETLIETPDGVIPICVWRTFATVLVQGEGRRRYIPLAEWPADARLTADGDYLP